MATFQELAESNPNIRQQYDEWREQRSQNGEDATDFQAFREHVMSMGSPDPGEQEIDDFVGEDFKPPTRSATRKPPDGSRFTNHHMSVCSALMRATRVVRTRVAPCRDCHLTQERQVGPGLACCPPCSAAPAARPNKEMESGIGRIQSVSQELRGRDQRRS